MFEIACPSCGKHFKTDERFAGRTAKCPNCATRIQIPSVSTSAPTPPDLPSHYPDPAAVQRPAGAAQPAKLKTVGIMSLAGGIWAMVFLVIEIVFLLFFVLGTFGFGLFVAPLMAPLMLYTSVMGIVAIVNGAMLLSGKIRRGGLPMTACIMQIVNVISCDIVNLILGILCLMNLRDPEVKAYFRQP